MIKTKNGISLIVLVITIIVMIILAAAVIISLNNAGIIKTAHNAVCMTNIKQAQNLAVLVWSELYTDPDSKYTVDDIKEKIKEEFTKNKLNADDYEITVTTGGVEVKSKAGCVDSSGVEGGSGDSGSDVIPTNWEHAYAYDRATATWTTVATNNGTEPTGDFIIRMYKTGREEKTVQTADGPFTATLDTYDMLVSGTGEIINIPEEKMILSSAEIGDQTGQIPTIFGTINLKIQEGITSIGEDVFDDCVFLKTIAFPSTLTTIKAAAFSNICGLEELIIPEGVENIERQAFEYCEGIKNIILPDSLSSLGEGDKNNYGAFACCSALESVTIPASLTRIPDYTFYNCENLKTVNFKGTEEQWNSILENSTHWSNDILKEVTVNYTGK